jgi:ribosomal protein L19E
LIKEQKGRGKLAKRKTRRRYGSIKLKVNTRKKDYVTLIRKQRAHLKYLKDNKKITLNEFNHLRKEIKTRAFPSLASLKEHIKDSSGAQGVGSKARKKVHRKKSEKKSK